MRFLSISQLRVRSRSGTRALGRGFPGSEMLFLSSRYFSSDAEDRRKRGDQIRSELSQRISQGPFFKYHNSIGSISQKPIETMTRLIPFDHAETVSSFQVESIVSEEEELSLPLDNKIFLLGIGFNQMSFNMLEAWSAVFFRNFKDDEEVNYFQVSVIDNWLSKRVFPSSTKSSLKHSIENNWRAQRDAAKQTGVYFGTFGELKKELGITSTLHGYTFLFDKQKRLRWKASGEPTEEEIQLFKDFVSDIKNERNR